jgi:hypothetical protein
MRWSPIFGPSCRPCVTRTVLPETRLVPALHSGGVNLHPPDRTMILPSSAAAMAPKRTDGENSGWRMIAINQGARARALDAPRACSFQSGGYMQLEPGSCTG